MLGCTVQVDAQPKLKTQALDECGGCGGCIFSASGQGSGFEPLHRPHTFWPGTKIPSARDRSTLPHRPPGLQRWVAKLSVSVVGLVLVQGTLVGLCFTPNIHSLAFRCTALHAPGVAVATAVATVRQPPPQCGFGC